MKYLLLFIILFSINTHLFAQQIEWKDPLHLPNPTGVAGAFGGIVGNYLIVAGGANFPIKAPWDGGVKTWHPSIYYKNINSDNSKWVVSKNELPYPIAYGVSIQTGQGLLCIGGCDANRCYNEVLLINIEKGILKITNDFPKLPVPLANATGSIINNRIYIAGGNETVENEEATSHFFMLDLSKLGNGWQKLDSWQGSQRGYAVSAAQDGKFYLFSGRNYSKKTGIQILTDAHIYNPLDNSWTIINGKFPVMAGSALPLGKKNILLLGGTDTIISGSNSHPGFGNNIRIFDPTINKLDSHETPHEIAVTTAVAHRGNTFYICSGETKPGIRTPLILKATIKP